MKTPEEIKDSLKLCRDTRFCKECELERHCTEKAEALEYINQLEGKIADGANAQLWINAAERLPKNGSKVVICGKPDNAGNICAYDVGIYSNDTWEFGCGEPFCVNYWFELPDMPGETDKK